MPIPGRTSRGGSRAGKVFLATDGRDILENTPDGWEVEQPWLWFDGPANGDGTGGPWGNPPPNAAVGPSSAGSTLPAMARCRALIADAIAGVPWEVYRGREKLTTPAWISDPQGLEGDQRIGTSVRDVVLSSVEFWSSFIVSAIELGEGIVYCPRTNDVGEVVRPWGPPMYVLNPNDVEVENGGWVVNDVPISADEILCVRNRVWPGKYRGVGVWEQFRAQLGLGTSIREYASNMLGRGIPAGYLKVNSPDLSQEEAELLKQRWMKAHGGSTRRIAVLNATTEFHPLQLDPQALQLSELMRLSAWEITLIYGIPPYKLGLDMGASNTYANIESASIDYVQDALLPWARRIEDAFDAILPYGTTLSINLDGLRRADTKTRYDAYAVGLDKGFLTIDEVRARENLPPLTGPATTELTVTAEEVQPGELARSVVRALERKPRP